MVSSGTRSVTLSNLLASRRKLFTFLHGLAVQEILTVLFSKKLVIIYQFSRRNMLEELNPQCTYMLQIFLRN